MGGSGAREINFKDYVIVRDGGTLELQIDPDGITPMEVYEREGGHEDWAGDVLLPPAPNWISDSWMIQSGSTPGKS